MNIIDIKNLYVNFGDTIALRNINLSIKSNDYVAIIGPNGGGKSTLIKTILGLINPSNGSVELFGEKPSKTRGRVGLIPQFSKSNRDFPITVLEAVLSGALNGKFHPFFKYNTATKDKANKMLQLLDIEKISSRQIQKLSGGEFQRMLIARALMNDPELLLLDEPTSNIDPKSRELIYNILDDYNKKHTILMVSHDLIAVARNVKSIICLNKDLIYHGEPSLTQETVTKLYGCPIDLIAHGVPHRVLSEHGGDCSCEHIH